jgi:hypothetical protein
MKLAIVGSTDLKPHQTRAARHLYRLCYQGFALYETGNIIIRLDEHLVNTINYFGDEVAEGNTKVAEMLIKTYEARFDSINSPLPNQPNKAVVEEWLKDVRRAFL